MKTKYIASLASIVLATAMLTGCGGDEGGGTAANTNPGNSGPNNTAINPSTKILIDPSNQTNVATYAIAVASQSFGEYNIAFAEIASASASALLPKCDSGKFAGTPNADKTAYTIVFSKCTVGSVTHDGTLAITKITHPNSTTPTDTNATFNFTNLTSTETIAGTPATTSTTILNGGFDISATGLGTPNRTIVMTGTNLSVADGLPGADTSTYTLSTFKLTSTYDGSVNAPPHAYSLNYEVTVDSPGFKGIFSLEVAAKTPILQTDVLAEQYPVGGEIIVRGAENSAIKVIITSKDPKKLTYTIAVNSNGGSSFGNPIPQP